MNRFDVMVVDDNPDEILIIKRILKKAQIGIELHTVHSGKEALEFLINNDSTYKLVLILLDIKMPGMNGIELLHNIRSDKKFDNLPIVMLTSSNLPSDIEAAYKEGANSFVQKSPDYHEYTEILISTINYWVEINKVP